MSKPNARTVVLHRWNHDASNRHRHQNHSSVHMCCFSYYHLKSLSVARVAVCGWPQARRHFQLAGRELMSERRSDRLAGKRARKSRGTEPTDEDKAAAADVEVDMQDSPCEETAVRLG